MGDQEAGRGDPETMRVDVALDAAHIPRRALPMALAELHRALAVDVLADVTVFEDDHEGHDQLLDVVDGAGFAVEAIDTPVEGTLTLRLRRSFTLADTVGPGMRLLLCGLNPSRYAADHGVGFARASNRFWPAMMAAGLADRPNDSFALLYQQRVGMTDLVKRATPRAEEIARDEYLAGFARVERLVEWLQPGAVAFVGLDGWRKVVERGALPGPAGRLVGGRPAYVLPSTSGLNAHSSLTDLTDHLRAAARLAQNARP